jgi:hypothetical protein
MLYKLFILKILQKDVIGLLLWCSIACGTIFHSIWMQCLERKLTCYGVRKKPVCRKQLFFVPKLHSVLRWSIKR